MDSDFNLECLGFNIVNGYSPCVDIFEDLTIYNHVGLVKLVYGFVF